MEKKADNRESKLPLKFENFDQYDMADCTNILRHLESQDKEDEKDRDLKYQLHKLDNQLHYTFFL